MLYSSFSIMVDVSYLRQEVMSLAGFVCAFVCEQDKCPKWDKEQVIRFWSNLDHCLDP